MFTGIVQAIGEVREFRREGGGARLTVATGLSAEAIRLGDSIAIDGCCQTVASFDGGVCVFHALAETLSRTVFGEYRAGRKVNVEPALKLGDRLGGHIVTGHIDGVVAVKSIARRGGDIALTLARPQLPPAEFPLVPKGSIAINGISLTVAELTDETVTVCIIPHTWEHTTMQFLRAGDRVNVEGDAVGKYVAGLIQPYAPARVTMERLREAGF